jgi:ABC-2 type transport system ATP-binding protein
VGSVDPLIKAAARFEVVEVTSGEPSLEELFLTYYGAGEAGDLAAGGPRPDGGDDVVA